MKFYTKYFIREYFRLRVLVFCFVFSGFMFFTYGTSHYVDKNANGSNNGTSWANAWESFAAINWGTVQPGDFIYISGGSDSTVYNETMTVNASGSPGNFIVITKGKESGHNGKVILDGSGTIQYGIVFSKSAGLSYLKFSNLYFRNYEQAVRVLDAANVIYLDSLNIRGQWGQGAITLSGWNSNGDPTLIDSIFIRYCDIRSDIQVDAQTDNIFIQYANNVFIFNNHIEQLNTTGAQHIDCIQTANSLGSYYIANNYIKNIKYINSQAMMLNHPNPGYRGVLYNNVVTGVARLTVASNSYGGMENFYFINNTLDINSPIGTYVLSIWDSIAVVKNNIIYAPSSPNGGYAVDINTRGDRYDYNISDDGGTTYAVVSASLARTVAWLQGSPMFQDLHSLFFTDPLFNDPSSGDFSLSTNSPAIGAGENLQSLIESFGLEWKSINGIPRGNSPSMGAYEIAQGGGNNPPNQPANPEPVNGAINQSTNTTLTWSCSDPDGDPLTYDVYFGTSNNPPLVSGNQPGTDFNPGQLNNNTTYYWKIVAKDNQGATNSSPVWSFSTEVSGSGSGNSVTVEVKVFLEGPYTDSGMTTDLSNESLVPLTQPYFNQPWNYTGNEEVSVIPQNAVDWILLELRTGTGASSIISRRAALLRNDGMAVDLNGSTKVTFPGIESGPYYVVIYHRNHLAIMTKNPVLLTDSSSLYDFTMSEDQAYGNQAMKSLGNGKFGLYAADGNSNGSVNNSDYNSVWKRENGSIGYDWGDFDLNGGVNIVDRNSKWKPNNGKVTRVP